MGNKMKLTIIVFIGVIQIALSKISDSENVITALIRNHFPQYDETPFNHDCKIQTLYDCLVECDCSKNPTNCTLNSCIYTCYLFSKPNVNDCSKDLMKHAMVLSFLTSNKKSSRNSVSDCHHRCPWSTHCDQCPNCKWCWLCSSCNVPNKNCKYCRVCKGKESDCVKCCGY